MSVYVTGDMSTEQATGHLLYLRRLKRERQLERQLIHYYSLETLL